MHATNNEANNNCVVQEKQLITAQEAAAFMDTGNVEILFQRPFAEAEKEVDGPKSVERREDKFKSTADIASKKPSTSQMGDNIDLKMRGLIPKMLKAVDDIRYDKNRKEFY